MRLCESWGVSPTYNTSGVLTETRHCYFSDQWQIVREMVSGSTAALYIWGLRYIDELLVRYDPTYGRKYAMQDANFNCTAICDDATGAGSVNERYQYDPYAGNRVILDSSWNVISTSAYNWTVGHQGLMFEAEVGIYNCRNRVYLPILGTWMQRDPIGYADGGNLYEYLLANPVIYVDSIGQQVMPNPSYRHKFDPFLMHPGVYEAPAPPPDRQPYGPPAPTLPPPPPLYFIPNTLSPIPHPVPPCLPPNPDPYFSPQIGSGPRPSPMPTPRPSGPSKSAYYFCMAKCLGLLAIPYYLLIIPALYFCLDVSECCTYTWDPECCLAAAACLFVPTGATANCRALCKGFLPPPTQPKIIGTPAIP